VVLTATMNHLKRGHRPEPILRKGDWGRPVRVCPLYMKRVDFVRIQLVREATTLYARRQVKGPEDATDLVKSFVEDMDREVFLVVCLGTKHEPTAIHTVSVGTLNSCAIHPREVFKVAILANSAAVILAHNHPSGDPTPSKEDIEVTGRLKNAGQILGIEVMDHIIIGSNGYASLKEMGVV